MIFTDSRYATGRLAKTLDSRDNTPKVTVFRQFPGAISTYYLYTWKQRDRIDVVAHTLLGDPNLWWLIMDYNPEVIDPLNIPIGTVLRIPNG